MLNETNTYHRVFVFSETEASRQKKLLLNIGQIYVPKIAVINGSPVTYTNIYKSYDEISISDAIVVGEGDIRTITY